MAEVIADCSEGSSCAISSTASTSRPSGSTAASRRATSSGSGGRRHPGVEQLALALEADGQRRAEGEPGVRREAVAVGERQASAAQRALPGAHQVEVCDVAHDAGLAVGDAETLRSVVHAVDCTRGAARGITRR